MISLPIPLRSRGPSDQGVTLVEMLITLMILTMFLGLFGLSLSSLLRGAQRQAGSISAQQSTRDAFLRLDKQIRYADAITSPSTISGSTWIEWRVPDPTIPVAQSATQERCFQWQASASAGTLKYRTWIVPTSGAVSVPSWVLVASGLVIGAQPVFTTTLAGLQAAPFSLPSNASATYGQVGVALNVTQNSPAGRSSVSTVFTALNSGASPAAVCTEVARS